MVCLVDKNGELNNELTDIKQMTFKRQSGSGLLILPGHPRAAFDTNEMDEKRALTEYLENHLITRKLDILTQKWLFWLWAATPTSTHIRPLHSQACRGRDKIILAEDPALHLIFLKDRIYIKPIPRYLLSHVFWIYLQDPACDALRQAAIGFLRSYTYIIRFETDFQIAQEHSLIPTHKGATTDEITFETFSLFINKFASILDSEVSPRYRYGELNLSNLNWATRVYFQGLIYAYVYEQWGPFLAPVLASLILFITLSTAVLTALQVGLAVEGLKLASEQAPNATIALAEQHWQSFDDASRWFSVAILIAFTATVGYVIAFKTFLVCHNVYFAKRTRDDENIAKKKSIAEQKEARRFGKKRHTGAVV